MCNISLLFLLFLQISSVSMFQQLVEQKELENQSNQINQISESILTTNHIVDLALFCDRDFNALFQHNNSKILEYWEAMLYDVQLRFDTLSSTKFTFRITQLLSLEMKDQQKIVEPARAEPDSVDIFETIPAFPDWVYSKFGNSTNFDIAILALGAKSFGGIAGIGRFDTICKIETAPEVWHSVAVFSVRSWKPALVFTHEIAHVLGAPHVDELPYSENRCGKLSVIKGIMNIRAKLSERHSFLRCTDKIFFNKYSNFSLNCLRDSKTNATPIIDTASLEKTSSFSFLEQCRLRTNNLDVYINQSESNCLVLQCRTGEHSVEYLQPMNGSPCKDQNGTSGTCFRNICMPPGVFLKHTSKNCLSEHGTLLWNMPGKVVSSNCSNLVANPKNAIRIRKNGDSGVWLMKYSWDLDNLVQRNCLVLSLQPTFLWIPKFKSCSSDEGTNWIIGVSKYQNKSNDFILYHLGSRTCLQYFEESGKLLGSRNCSGNNGGIFWNLMQANGEFLTHTNFHTVVHTLEPEQQILEMISKISAIGAVLLLLVGVIVVLAARYFLLQSFKPRNRFF